MDPFTLILTATLFMLLNGGVLGIVHSSLPADVRTSARDWRIGTLLLAGGGILLAVQRSYPPGFILPLGNGLMFMGLALYYRSIRRFFSLDDTAYIWIPIPIGVAGVYWFAAVEPTFAGRVIVAAPVLALYLVLSTRTVLAKKNNVHARSQRVLAGIFLFLAATLLLRAILFIHEPTREESLISATSWITIVTTLVISVLPVIGTTAFLMMCQERVSARWEEAAAMDYLTNLPNRRTISANGSARFSHAQRLQQSNFAVAIIDIDHFKSINDRFGHDIGDLALIHIANVLRDTCRGSSMVGRQGGEEFVVLMDVANANEASVAAERLRRAIEDTPLLLASTQLRMTTSVGVSVFTAADKRYDDMLNRADRALYQAKKTGRNRVEMADA
jgi:diguanylate cyclase (GGDEF)-like protein